MRHPQQPRPTFNSLFDNFHTTLDTSADLCDDLRNALSLHGVNRSRPIGISVDNFGRALTAAVRALMPLATEMKYTFMCLAYPERPGGDREVACNVVREQIGNMQRMVIVPLGDILIRVERGSGVNETLIPAFSELGNRVREIEAEVMRAMVELKAKRLEVLAAAEEANGTKGTPPPPYEP